MFMYEYFRGDFIKIVGLNVLVIFVNHKNRINTMYVLFN